jgi:hypothetical protein
MLSTARAGLAGLKKMDADSIATDNLKCFAF